MWYSIEKVHPTEDWVVKCQRQECIWGQVAATKERALELWTQHDTTKHGTPMVAEIDLSLASAIAEDGNDLSDDPFDAATKRRMLAFHDSLQVRDTVRMQELRRVARKRR